MKKLLKKKTAAVLVFAMIVSVFMPIIAFAADFSGITQNGNKLSGSFTLSDTEYSNIAGDRTTISIGVYGPNGQYSIANATYSDGKYVLDNEITIAQNTYLMYGNSDSRDTITEFTYSTNDNNNGGVWYFPPADVVNADGTVNRDALINLFNANADATIHSKSDVVLLPADALIKGKSLTIVLEDGTSITLPIAALKLEELAKSLGVELKDLVIRVELKKVTGDAADKIGAAATAVGGKQVAPAVDFKVVAVAGDKEQAITTFGQYVQRTIPLNEVAADTSGLVGVLYNPVTGEFSFVPTTFATENDKTMATLKRNGNSIYTVIQAKAVSFADLAGNWAQKDVEALASKLIVKGTSATKFEPKRNITRAEFAALVVRALGLEVSGTTSKFKDVASDKWYAATIATAVNAGLITGYEDGTFKPNANITRKELAAIVTRAITFAGKDVTLTDEQISAALANFKDADSLGWAKGEVAVAVSEGIVNGQTATTVAGNANANRAEAATMIARFLGNVGFVK